MYVGDMAEHELVEARTRAWVDEIVVGLDLCPFAAPSLEHDALLIEITSARDPEAIAHDLIAALQRLQAPETQDIETLLFVVCNGLSDFLEFNAFLEVSERLIDDLGLEGVFQIASFHPDYCFAETPPDDAANFTNRSPYPMLHLLREDAIARAIAQHPDPEGIPARNVAKLRDIGNDAMAKKLSVLRREPRC